MQFSIFAVYYHSFIGLYCNILLFIFIIEVGGQSSEIQTITLPPLLLQLGKGEKICGAYKV